MWQYNSDKCNIFTALHEMEQTDDKQRCRNLVQFVDCNQQIWSPKQKHVYLFCWPKRWRFYCNSVVEQLNAEGTTLNARLQLVVWSRCVVFNQRVVAESGHVTWSRFWELLGKRMRKLSQDRWNTRRLWRYAWKWTPSAGSFNGHCGKTTNVRSKGVFLSWNRDTYHASYTLNNKTKEVGAKCYNKAKTTIFLSIQNELMSILNNYTVHPATEVYEHIKKTECIFVMGILVFPH